MTDRRRAPARRAALRWGLHAEAIAAVFLALKFYRVLALRYRVRGGEVDLIVRRGSTIAFVEVKARRTFEAARVSIDPGKERRFRQAVRAWVAAHPWSTALTLRGDAVYVVPWRLPRHAPGVIALEE